MKSVKISNAEISWHISIYVHFTGKNLTQSIQAEIQAWFRGQSRKCKNVVLA